MDICNVHETRTPPWTLWVGALLLTATAGSPSEANQVFYEGKEIRLIVGGSPGGGYDAYARMIAPFLTKHIPGNPSIRVENMPGSGSVRAANYLSKVAPKDGTVIATLQRDIAVLPLYGYGTGAVQYDASRFHWIGNLNDESMVCASWHTSKAKTIHDVMVRELITGGTGPNDTETFPVAMNSLVGTKFKIVSGYIGTTQLNLAMERGEIEGRCGWSWTSLKTFNSDWLRDRRINILVQFTLKPLAELKDVPLAVDLAKTDLDRKILSFLSAPLVLGRPFLTAPDVPQDRVNTLRKAFAAAANDPELLNNARSRHLDISLMAGIELQTLIGQLAKTPPELIQAAAKAMKSK